MHNDTLTTKASSIIKDVFDTCSSEGRCTYDDIVCMNRQIKVSEAHTQAKSIIDQYDTDRKGYLNKQ